MYRLQWLSCLSLILHFRVKFIMLEYWQCNNSINYNYKLGNEDMFGIPKLNNKTVTRCAASTI